MRLEGIHHITAITADAPANVDFYGRVLGLRMVKKTVNFDDPTAYHLYYGDEQGSPGSILTFFEYRGVGTGSAGAGMVHRIIWRVDSAASLDFWQQRLGDEELLVHREELLLRFRDPEGLEHELVVEPPDSRPLKASFAGIPPEHAINGFHGARAYAWTPDDSRPLLDALGYQALDGRHDNFRLPGSRREATWSYDEPPDARGVPGAGTVHHIAWECPAAEHVLWRERAVQQGAHVTPVIDRQYFKSIYFREPSGVLFEIATDEPGFAVDEDPGRLGEALKLPPQHERLRDRLERSLTPLVNPREQQEEAIR
jgi:glyoxalase family protein